MGKLYFFQETKQIKVHFLLLNYGLLFDSLLQKHTYCIKITNIHLNLKNESHENILALYFLRIILIKHN